MSEKCQAIFGKKRHFFIQTFSGKTPYFDTKMSKKYQNLLILPKSVPSLLAFAWNLKMIPEQ
jgi:hypothetical protein